MNGKIKTLAKQKKWHRRWALALVLVIAVVTLGVVLTNNRTTHNKQVATHIPAKGPAVKEPAQKKSDKSSSSTGNNSPVSDKSSQPSVSSGALTAPSGTFVSNHRPSLGGSALLRQEKSVCNTTPNATCYMLFMKDGLTKTLASQTVDSTGSTYWLWDVNKAGFTEGSWKVTAVVTLNGQTQTADDSLPLEVQP